MTTAIGSRLPVCSLTEEPPYRLPIRVGKHHCKFAEVSAWKMLLKPISDKGVYVRIVDTNRPKYVLILLKGTNCISDTNRSLNTTMYSNELVHGDKYILSLICFARMDFSEQSRIEVHFEQNISTIVSLSRIWWDDVNDANITSW
jgi:hypothetical protein